MLPKNRPPAHPGEVLWEEFLKPLEISQSHFAQHLGGTWTQPKVSEIINKKRRITEIIALDFADAFGTSPEFWLNLQANYDLWFARQYHETVPLLDEFKTNPINRPKKASSRAHLSGGRLSKRHSH